MKRIIVALLAAVAGLALLLTGLGVDAWLHAKDETLAAREGVFSLSNPGHLLLAGGIGLAATGTLAALYFAWGLVAREGILSRRWVRAITMQVSGVAAAGAVLLALGVSASAHDHGAASPPSAVGAHVHDDATMQESAEPSMHEEHEAGISAAAGAAEERLPAQAAGAAPSMETMPVVAGAATAGTHTHAETTGEAASMVAGAAHRSPEPTAEERACFEQLTADAKVATARFADINVAIAEGYLISDDPTKTHMPNRAYMRDGRSLDLANPETLVYVTDASGERRFVGAMYRALKGHGPAPCGNATYWHTHGRCLAPDGTSIPEDTDKTCPAGYVWRDGMVEMMHVWFVPRKQRT
jgi:hypothetical protein